MSAVRNNPRQRRPTGKDFLQQLEQAFDRQALLPRMVILVALFMGAWLERSLSHGTSHWIVLAIYGASTLSMVALSRASRAWHELAWIGTSIDAALAVYLLAEHLPRDLHEVYHASDTLSLVPVLLLLLQTGFRLRPSLVVLFGAIVLVGWGLSLAAVLLPETELIGAQDGRTIWRRQAQGLSAFLAAAFFVLTAVSWLRNTAVSAWRAREERLLISRFLPDGVAGELVRGGHGVDVAERQACLLSVDIRGSSVLAREYPAAQTIAWLLAFRRLVHEAVAWRHGIVDKYVGDGVLALFIEGGAQDQAENALAAARAIAVHLQGLNVERSARAEPPLRIITVLHCGTLLAGVFDDGYRAEFTVLGAPMNELPRMERRAKEAGVDLVASLAFIQRLPPAIRDNVNFVQLASSSPEVPDMAVLQSRDQGSARRPGGSNVG